MSKQEIKCKSCGGSSGAKADKETVFNIIYYCPNCQTGSGD